jgi:hypothetical protein
VSPSFRNLPDQRVEKHRDSGPTAGTEGLYVVQSRGPTGDRCAASVAGAR